MPRIYDFSRNPAERNFTIRDLQNLKGSGTKLSMANPANNDEIRACVEAGIDLFVVGTEQMEDVRELAPMTFTGAGSSWSQFGSDDEIVAHACESMRRRSSPAQAPAGARLAPMMRSWPTPMTPCAGARICTTRCALMT